MSASRSGPSRFRRPWLEGVADIVTILAGLSAVAVLVLVLLRNSTSLAPGETGPPSVVVQDWQRFSAEGHRIGPADAPVTIVEFGDYQCRYCREAEPHLSAIRRKYGDGVSLVFRHFPLVMESVSHTAARAAECASEQGRFWEYHQQLFSSRAWQTEEPMEVFERIGNEVGLADPASFKDCVALRSPVPAITADLNAAEQLAISGTPAFLVNDRLFMGVLDSLEFDLTYREVRR